MSINEGFSNKGITPIEEVSYGMYVWETPDGSIVQDEDGNVMNVFCIKGDRAAIKAITDAARHYGFPEGSPVWWSGKRRVTDEELEEQTLREKFGLVPDPLDYGAVMEDMRWQQQHG